VDQQGNPVTPDTEYFAIQMVDDSEANAATLALIGAYQLETPKKQNRRAGYLNVVVKIPADRLPDIAAQPEVVSIQPYHIPQLHDERQDMIISGHIIGNAPSGPGYLAWLTSKGFAQTQFTASGFAVDVTDSGIDNGTTSPNHFGLYVDGVRPGTSRVAYNRLEVRPMPAARPRAATGTGR